MVESAFEHVERPGKQCFGALGAFLNKNLCIMADRKQSSGTWKWLLVALLVAAIAVAVLFYIGWFDTMLSQTLCALA